VEGADAETAESFWTRKELGGDWGGARTALGDLGISLDVRVSQYYQEVAAGGADTGGQYGGVANYVMNVDGEKIGLWKGLYLNVHATTRWGRDVLKRTGVWSLPNTELMYPQPGKYSGFGDTKLTGYYALQLFADGKAAALAGKVHLVDIYSILMPNTMDGGAKGFMNFSASAPALPFLRYLTLSMWGAGAWTLNEDQMPMVGVLALGSEDVSTTNRKTHSSFDDGVSLIGFARATHTWDEKPGWMLLGVGTSTKRYKSLDGVDWVVVPNEGLEDTQKKKPWEVWVDLSQNLWQDGPEAKRKVRLFSAVAYGDDNPSFFDFATFVSVEGFGLIPGRPNDRMGVSGWHTNVSSNYRRLSSTLGDPQRDTWGVELYYNYEITPWLHVTPDVQIVQGSNRRDDPAVILGLRTVLDF
jgi:porin